MHVAWVFLDLNKPFDTVDHEIFLKKIENYGIRGIAWSLLKSYLAERSQYVQVGSTEYGIIEK